MKKQLVILGAGYGGLLTAVELEEKTRRLKDVEIVLVERNNYHQYLHLAYEIVTNAKKISDITLPLTELLQKLPLNYFDEVCRRDNFVGEAEVRAKEAGIKKVEVICAHGDPAEEILRAADQVTADLIVMGSRGLGRFSRVIMGSVSTKVCNHSNSTCVIVR